MSKNTLPRSLVLFVVDLAGWFTAHPGRPLTVDDANVNDTGAGHVETWWTRAPDGTRSWTVAPAYAPAENIELGAGFAREQRTGLETQNIQAKFRITASQDNGCNMGAVAGVARATGDTSRPYVNALMSCNHPTLGSIHTNVGALDVSSSQRVTTWGVAWERTYGEMAAHVEVYGQQHDKPTWATGVRFNVLPQLQLDTSVGRQNGHNLVTLGTKWMF